jgi:alkylation response protein AidB-like acyl-CoA dehydrogenase
MDFSISDEQEMLVDSVSRFIANDYNFEARQKIAQGNNGYSAANWQTFAELGWTAIPFDEVDGGLGGGPVELVLLMEQFGRGLVLEPYLANIILAGGILRRAADSTQKERWLTGLVSGEIQAALAFVEPQSRFNIADIATTAVKDRDGYVLNGNKGFVLNGGNADLLIIPCRTSGDQQAEHGISLFAVPANSDGFERNAYRTVDALQAAELALNDVRIGEEALLGAVDEGYATLSATIDDATLAVCAEAVGIMRTMHDKTVDYAKNRVQFGVPIGSFQALQHRMVDCLMACEQSFSLLLWTAMAAEDGGAGTAKAISALKYQVGTAGQQVAKEAVQIHGGMGVTWELDIAHYFKRMTAIDLMFGNADYHLDRYVALST